MQARAGSFGQGSQITSGSLQRNAGHPKSHSGKHSTPSHSRSSSQGSRQQSVSSPTAVTAFAGVSPSVSTDSLPRNASTNSLPRNVNQSNTMRSSISKDSEADTMKLPDLDTIIEGPATPAKPMDRTKKFDKLMVNDEKKDEATIENETSEGENSKNAGKDDNAPVNVTTGIVNVPVSPVEGASASPPVVTESTFNPDLEFAPREPLLDTDLPSPDEVQKVTDMLDNISDGGNQNNIQPFHPPYDYGIPSSEPVFLSKNTSSLTHDVRSGPDRHRDAELGLINAGVLPAYTETESSTDTNPNSLINRNRFVSKIKIG